MAKEYYFWTGIIAALLIGILGTYAFSDSPAPVVVERNVTVEKVINVPVNVTVEKTVADASVYLENAKKAIFHEFRHDNSFLSCGDDSYDLSEVTFSRIDAWSYNYLDDDKYSVTIEDARMKFKTTDARSCYDSRTFEVTFEEGEDPVVDWN